MRYKLTKQIKNIIKSNYKFLFSNPKLQTNIKNLIHVNKTISNKNIQEIIKTLNLNTNKLNLKKVKLPYEKNLGKYSFTKKITFHGTSKELAEFIGIMLGDGNIYKNQIRIVIDKREREFKNYIVNLFYKVFKVNLNSFIYQNRLILGKHNKSIVNILIKYGLKRGNKIEYGAKIPNWIKRNKDYLKVCLRGLIDTDGCVYKCKKDTKPYISFRNYGGPLLNGFYINFKRLGYNFVKSGKGNLVLCRKDEIRKFLNEINFSNPKHRLKFDGVVV